MGGRSVAWPSRLMSIGGFATNDTGRISPCTVRVRSSAASSPRCALVDVRVGLVADEDVRGLGHLRGNVAVEVERAGDGQLRPDGRPQPPQHLGIGVRILRRHHRAVQGDQDAVRFRASRMPVMSASVMCSKNSSVTGPEGVPQAMAIGDEIVAELLGAADEPADFVMGFAPHRHQCRAVGQARLRETGPGPVGGRGERVRLVHESADGDPHGRAPGEARYP